mgnify:CR=1 FL=1
MVGWHAQLTTRVARALMQQGADVNAAKENGVTALMIACQNGHEAVARALMQQGADVNAAAHNNYTERVGHAAMWGGMYRHAAHLRVLRECGCDLSFANAAGQCAASLAAADGCVESLRYLLEEAGVSDEGGRWRRELARLEASGAEGRYWAEH